MNIVRVQQGVFDSAVELEKLAQLGGGAVASFTGIARKDNNGAGEVTGIELEHYPTMTQSTLDELVNEAGERWDLLGCILIHRVGYIAVGEAIVLVGTASSHRADALAACSFLIDRLKTEAPFWKKEYRNDGSAVWVKPKESDNDRADEWSNES